MHDRHQNFFDQLAAEWDLMFTSEDLERLSNLVAAMPVTAGMEILDLGCGTGILFDMLRRRVGDTGSVTGVDFSIEMVEKAHRNFPFDNVNVVDGDVVNLPFKDATFDMGVAFSAFAHFSNQQKALDETHRVLKTGAKFYVIHLLSARELADAHQRVGGAVEHDKLPPVEKMRQMFQQSRFTEIKVDDHPGLYIATGTNAK
jgi:ubiquinone/menaquinone biosynthesis C-methylase UbiE